MQLSSPRGWAGKVMFFHTGVSEPSVCLVSKGEAGACTVVSQTYLPTKSIHFGGTHIGLMFPGAHFGKHGPQDYSNVSLSSHGALF